MKKSYMNILMVEDNPGDVRLVSEMLKECADASFRMLNAERLERALGMLSKESVDVVLLDLNLPDSRGLEGLEKIAAARPDIPIIVLTGLNDEAVGMEAVQKQAADYLIKGQINCNLLVRSMRYAIERKKNEGALRESEERYRGLAEAAHDMIYIIGRNDRIEYVNSYGAAYLGFEPRKIIGQDRAKFFSQEIAAGQEDSLERVFKTGKANYYENSMTVSGRTMWLGTWLTPLRRDGDVGAVLGISRDITARKEAEEVLVRDKDTFEKLVWKRTDELFKTQMKLERSKRLSDIGTLAATVAHELRNPLAAMNMAVANIRRKANNPALEKHLGNIERKILESDDIINNLLFYTRLKSPNYEDIKIYDVLTECVEVSKKQFKKKVLVKKSFNPIKNVSLKADPTQIKEVFCNIINNAHDAVPDSKGRIEITATCDKESVKFAFKDNGTGMSKNDIERLFEPFFTTKTRGTGLGLTVCKQIVDMHGGAIGIESEQDGGTTVAITLPRRHLGKA